MRKKPQKTSNTGLIPEAILRLGYVNGIQQLNKESRMSKQAQVITDKEPREPIGSSEMFNFFTSPEAMWWPFRTVSKALLQTQSNAIAYLEAQRRLVDEMQNIVRKEQNLVLELSETALATITKSGAPHGGASESAEVNEMFDRAMSGIRELGEAWIDAQVRSLDIMRSRDRSRTNTEIRTQAEAEAA
jgi:hypothetical protein